MATLEGKRIVVIGGSSGIGFCVARASLLNSAEHVYIASSTKAKVDGAVARLLADSSLQAQGRVSGDVVDLGNTAVVAEFFEKIGEIDHLVITSGTIRGTIDFRTEDLSKHKGLFFLAGHTPEIMLTSRCAVERRVRCEVLGRSYGCSESEDQDWGIHHVYDRYDTRYCAAISISSAAV